MDLPSQEEAGFKIYTIERYSTLPILDGAMKLTCGHTGMSVKARICTHEDFEAIHSSITENKRVRLKRKHELLIMHFQGYAGSSCSTGA